MTEYSKKKTNFKNTNSVLKLEKKVFHIIVMNKKTGKIEHLIDKRESDRIWEFLIPDSYRLRLIRNYNEIVRIKPRFSGI